MYIIIDIFAINIILLFIIVYIVFVVTDVIIVSLMTSS
jgi:hypothetical protein